MAGPTFGQGRPGYVEVQVRGHEQLAELGKRFKEEGNGKLRRELLSEIRQAVRPILPKIPANARSILPRRGGLAELYASRKIIARTSLSPKSAGVRILSRDRGRTRNVNYGRLRHPVPGSEKWVTQEVKEGWFSQPIIKDAPRIRGAIQQAMTQTARRIEKG